MPDMDLDALEAAAKKATPTTFKRFCDSIWDHEAPHEDDEAFYAAASPDVILSLVTRVREAESENEEQARLLGAGGSREAALQARVRELEHAAGEAGTADNTALITLREDAKRRLVSSEIAREQAIRERDELAEALREARRFAAGHHEQQPAHVLLHGLVVDLPEMIDAALAKIGSNDE